MSGELKRRLVVTGHNTAGRSCVAADSIVNGEDVPGMPGLEITRLWGSDEPMVYPDQGHKPTYTTFFPPLRGYRVLECCISPDTLAGSAAHEVDAAATAAELQTRFPGLIEAMSKEEPGVHRTASSDMVVIMEGRCRLQLDDAVVELKAGDLLIQSGTQHAWRNPYDEPCRFLAVSLGAKHDLCG